MTGTQTLLEHSFNLLSIHPLPIELLNSSKSSLQQMQGIYPRLPTGFNQIIFVNFLPKKRTQHTHIFASLFSKWL